MADFVGLKTLWRLRPAGPALDPWQRQRGFPVGPSGVSYGAPAPDGPPTPPLIPFGVAYDLDLVLVSDHPAWNMHEYAQLRTPEGPLWLCKDSRQADGSQELVVDLPPERLATLLPEVPLRRRAGPVAVDADLGPDRIDVSLAYTNHDGDAVRARYHGPPPRSPRRLRSGSAVEHSREQAMAALDLSHQDLGRGSIHIGGQPRALRRALGLVPMAVALRQGQGGLAVGDLRVEGDRMRFGDVAVPWQREGEDLVLRDPLRTLRWSFVDGELHSVTVHQFGRATPVFHAAFSPAIPDLRRPFDGTWAGRFVFDVGGQESHAVGRLEATSEGGVGRLDVIGERPWWVAERPLRCTVAGPHLRVDRVGG